MRLFSALVAALVVPVATACPPGDGVSVVSKCPPDGMTTLALRTPASSGSKAGGPEAKRLTPAVPSLRAGQRLSGTLASGDLTLSDDSFADLYRIVGTAGQRYSVFLRSDEFDAYLSVGTATSETDPEAFDVLDSDDDGAGGTDALVTFTMPADGTLYVRANSLTDGQTGAYTIEMADVEAAVGVLAVGESVDGRLDETDLQLADDSYVDLYTFTARAGQTYEITMTSSDFDAYLSVGSGTGDGYQEIDANDDGDGDDDGTNARITFTAATSGVHSIRANSLGNGETGAYTLRLVQN